MPCVVKDPVPETRCRRHRGEEVMSAPANLAGWFTVVAHNVVALTFRAAPNRDVMRERDSIPVYGVDHTADVTAFTAVWPGSFQKRDSVTVPGDVQALYGASLGP